MSEYVNEQSEWLPKTGLKHEGIDIALTVQEPVHKGICRFVFSLK